MLPCFLFFFSDIWNFASTLYAPFPEFFSYIASMIASLKFPWVFLSFLEFPQLPSSSLDFPRVPSTSLDFPPLPLNTLEFFVFKWLQMSLPEFPLVFWVQMSSEEFPWVLLSSIFILRTLLCSTRFSIFVIHFLFEST